MFQSMTSSPKPQPHPPTFFSNIKILIPEIESHSEGFMCKCHAQVKSAQFRRISEKQSLQLKKVTTFYKATSKISSDFSNCLQKRFKFACFSTWMISYWLEKLPYLPVQRSLVRLLQISFFFQTKITKIYWVMTHYLNENPHSEKFKGAWSDCFRFFFRLR